MFTHQSHRAAASAKSKARNIGDHGRFRRYASKELAAEDARRAIAAKARILVSTSSPEKVFGDLCALTPAYLAAQLESDTPLRSNVMQALALCTRDRTAILRLEYDKQNPTVPIKLILLGSLLSVEKISGPIALTMINIVGLLTSKDYRAPDLCVHELDWRLIQVTLTRLDPITIAVRFNQQMRDKFRASLIHASTSKAIAEAMTNAAVLCIVYGGKPVLSWFYENGCELTHAILVAFQSTKDECWARLLLAIISYAEEDRVSDMKPIEDSIRADAATFGGTEIYSLVSHECANATTDMDTS